MPKSDTLLSGKRCLVLDDEFLIALDIQQTLELAGAECVAAATSVPEALALLHGESEFNLAVLDVKLSGPDTNSLGVAALLAAKGNRVDRKCGSLVIGAWGNCLACTSSKNPTTEPRF